MDLRHFFTHQMWWGKVICACLGFLIAGPTGALLGVFIGNLFDRGLIQHFSNPLWDFHAEKNLQTKKIFFEATFSILGHIAKADGRVSEQEIQMAKKLMHEMNLNHTQQKLAQQYFNNGKVDQFNLEKVLAPLKMALHNNPQLLRLFINTQYNAAQLDGLSEKKINIFNTILRYMNFAPIYEQSRFNEDFYQRSYQRQNYSNQSNNNQTYSNTNSLASAYTVLQVAPTATKQEIKKAYRKLISRHHPDKLIARGESQAKIKLANEKTQVIRKAYEQICESRGW